MDYFIVLSRFFLTGYRTYVLQCKVLIGIDSMEDRFGLLNPDWIGQLSMG